MLREINCLKTHSQRVVELKLESSQSRVYELPNCQFPSPLSTHSRCSAKWMSAFVLGERELWPAVQPFQTLGITDDYPLSGAWGPSALPPPTFQYRSKSGGRNDY